MSIFELPPGSAKGDTHLEKGKNLLDSGDYPPMAKHLFRTHLCKRVFLRLLQLSLVRGVGCRRFSSLQRNKSFRQGNSDRIPEKYPRKGRNRGSDDPVPAISRLRTQDRAVLEARRPQIKGFSSIRHVHSDIEDLAISNCPSRESPEGTPSMY